MKALPVASLLPPVQVAENQTKVESHSPPQTVNSPSQEVREKYTLSDQILSAAFLQSLQVSTRR